MTTTTEPLTPGEHVLVEAVARREGPRWTLDVIAARDIAGSLPLANLRADTVRWRRMPDGTAAEPRRQQVIPTTTGPMWPHNTWTIPATGGRLDSPPAPEPLAAGVPVGSLPGEPGPGAYLIGDLLAVRFPGNHHGLWIVQDAKGSGWTDWDTVRRAHADKPMRRLLPRAIQEDRFADPALSLDAIGDVVTRCLRGVLDEIDRDTATAREQRDAYAAENARLRQELHSERKGAETLEAERDEIRRELLHVGDRCDEAIARTAPAQTAEVRDGE